MTDEKDKQIAELRETIGKAYGFLWHDDYEMASNWVRAARWRLRNTLTKSEQKEGITYARARAQTEFKEAENTCVALASTTGGEDRISGWQPIETAPKDGEEIFTDQGWVFWSDRPVCMLGPVNGGFSPGWATGRDSGADYNLPVETPTRWLPTLPTSETPIGEK